MKKDLILDERELAEIHHALYYAQRLHHGTVGHNQLMLLAKMADALGFYLAQDRPYSTGNTLMLEGQDAVKELTIHAGS